MKTRVTGDGIHIFDRATGFNLLIDEFQLPESDWHVAPRFASFALTNSCDLHCPFCYAPKEPATLGFADVIAWSVALDNAGCLGVGFGGGEPTLYPRFGELCKTLSHTTQLSVSLTTHAHRFSLALQRALTGSVHFIRVSMDGVGETYERIRGRSFPHLLNQLLLIRDTCHFGINFVVNDATVHELSEAATLAFDRGAREFLLLPEYSAENVLSQSTNDALYEWIAANHSSMRLFISDSHVSDSIPIADPFVNDKGVDAYVHINAFGKLCRTSYDQRASVSVPYGSGIISAIQYLRGASE